MRRILALAAVAVAVLAPLAPSITAKADPPGTEGPFEGTAFLLSCGDFNVLDDFVVSSSFKPIFDKDEKLVGFQEQVWGTDTLRNSLTGKSYTGTFHNSVRVDFETELGTNRGIIFRIVVPGAGAVFLDVGRFVSNRDATVVTFQAGPHQFYAGDMEALCDALR